jgi:hypothetical protein
MRQILIGEKEYEIDEEKYLAMLLNLAKGNCDFAKAIHNYHGSGFADWRNTFRMADVWNNEIAIAITDQIDDHELSKEFKSMRKNWLVLQRVDLQITEWLADYVELSKIDNKSDRVKLERRLKKIIIDGPGGVVQGPVWINKPSYQKILSKSKACLISMQKSEEKIYQRVEKLLSRYKA